MSFVRAYWRMLPFVLLAAYSIVWFAVLWALQDDGVLKLYEHNAWIQRIELVITGLSVPLAFGWLWHTIRRM